MTDSPPSLTSLLSTLDSETVPTTEMEISGRVRALRSQNDDSEPPMEWLAEMYAFGFDEDYRNHETGWGTYFGPLMVLNNKDGTVSEYPSIQKITPEILAYWKTRARNALHPMARARYADLVWDFCKTVTGAPPEHTFAQTAVDSYVEVVVRNLDKHESNTVVKLRRALSLAISLNDPGRIATVKDSVIAYEDRIAQDTLPGLWGFSYDLLWDSPRVSLSAGEKAKLVGDLEARLGRLSGAAAPDPHATQAAALRLAGHYRRLGRKTDVRRVLEVYGTTFERAAANASALLATSWLQGVHDVYIDFGQKDLAELVLKRLHTLGPKVTGEMKPISHTFEVPKEKMDAYVDALLDGTFEDACIRIAARYIPSRNATEDQLKDLSQRAPLHFLFATVIQDGQGRPIAKIGPLAEDPEGHVVMQTSQNMQVSAVFLHTTLERFCAKFAATASSIAECVFKSPLFKLDRKPIIERGIHSLFQGDWLVGAHLLIPQIEEAIRTLIELAGGSPLKPSKSGGLDVKTLDELLRDPVTVGVLGEDASSYLRVLLTDRRGWNIRNNICHGLYSPEYFGPMISDRLMHVLLCIAQVRENQPETS